MFRILRIVLVVLGLVVAVYGVASLTGGWLGEPPWWRGRLESTLYDEAHPNGPSVYTWGLLYPRRLCSAGVVLAGVALVWLGARARTTSRRTGESAPASPPRVDARRFLAIPSYLVVNVLFAAATDDWYTVVVCQRGPLFVVPHGDASDIIGGLAIAALLLVTIVESVRTPSFLWLLLLVPLWFLWFAFGAPRVWHA